MSESRYGAFFRVQFERECIGLRTGGCVGSGV